MSNNKFYEEECLERVRRIARHLDELASNPVDVDEIEERIDELESFNNEDDYIDNPNYDENKEDSEPYILTEEATEELKELKEQFEEYENGEPSDLYSYFSDCLDVEYRIGGDGSYRGVAVAIAIGGPHIEVDTGDNAVKLWWGGDKAEWSISSDTSNQIDDIFEEYYNCLSR